jgi:hypothetical protein
MLLLGDKRLVFTITLACDLKKHIFRVFIL